MGKCNKELLLKLLCEFLASMFTQFVGCSFPSQMETITPMKAAVYVPVKPRTQMDIVTSLSYSFSWGAGVLASTQAFRIISGAHINPCISIAAIIVKSVDWFDGLMFILVQLVGSALGFGLAWGLFRSKGVNAGFCVTMVQILPWWKSIFIEMFITGAWVLAMCSSWHSKNEKLIESISLRIGLVVIGACLVGERYTGASMNPFRSLWPALAAQYWKYLYVYIVIPPITAALLAVFWRFIYADEGEAAKDGE